ncbi:hypothetical protein JL720_8261 [Aureococcus anophagefferens]|nr:hypothetical protein JL720_8261 [Aureococcus anophagefferens]
MLLAIGALVAAARRCAAARADRADAARRGRSRRRCERRGASSCTASTPKRAACEPGSCTCKACCAANMTAHACRACVVAEGCVKVDDAPSRAGRPLDPDPAARPRACWPADGSAFDGGEAYWLNIADVEAERFNQPQFIHIAKTGGSAMRRCVPKARRPSGGSKARPDHVCSSDWHVPLRAYDASWRARTMADWPTFCVVRRRCRVFRVDIFPGNRRSPAGTPTSGSCRSSATRADRKLARLELLTNETTAKQRRRIRRMCNALRLSCVNDDCHSLPQSSSVFYADGARSCTHVVRYDDSAQLQRLKAAYGVATMGAHSFDCVDKRHSDSREFVLLGDARLHAGDIPPAIRRRLEAAYAADFAMFNFCVKR